MFKCRYCGRPFHIAEARSLHEKLTCTAAPTDADGPDYSPYCSICGEPNH